MNDRVKRATEKKIKYAPVHSHTIGFLMTMHKESQKDLGDAIGANRDKINNILQGRSKLDVDSLIRIAKHFNVTTDYILGLAKEPTDDWDVERVCEFTGLSKDTVMFLNNPYYLDSNGRKFVRYFIDSILDLVTIRATIDSICRSGEAAILDQDDDKSTSFRKFKAEFANMHKSMNVDTDGLYLIEARSASAYYRRCAIDTFESKCSETVDAVIESVIQHRSVALALNALMPEEDEKMEE